MSETPVPSDLDVDARRARVLNALSLWFLLGLVGLLMVALTTPQTGETRGDVRLSAALAGIAAALVLSYALSRQGALRAAIGVFELALNAALAAVLAALGAFSPALVLVPVVVLSTAVLWSRHAAVWLTLVWGVAYLVTALAEQGGFEPLLLVDGQVFSTAVSIWLGLLGFGLIGILAWLELALTPHESQLSPDRTQRQTMETQPPAPPKSAVQPEGGSGEGQGEAHGPPIASSPHPFPVVPLFHGTVVLPVSGDLDTALGEQLLSDLFRGIVEYDAQFVLLDVTHVPVIHQAAAHSMARVVAGAGLVGAEVALVGIGPRLASRLVELDVNLRGATTHVDMESALRYALYRLGRISRPRLGAGTPTGPAFRQLESGDLPGS